MSGSGGGGWAGEPLSDDCSELSQLTTLNSPQREVLETLDRKDLLEICLKTGERGVIVEARKAGQLAGTITFTRIQNLVECIQSGYSYVAEVIEVIGGACRVRVRSK